MMLCFNFVVHHTFMKNIVDVCSCNPVLIGERERALQVAANFLMNVLCARNNGTRGVVETAPALPSVL